MIKLGDSIPDDEVNQWRYRLDDFVEANQLELAALAWGLRQEWGDTKDVLGIDLKPQPHFVCCDRKSLETLNRKVSRKIQEILGILDGYNLDEEVAMIGIGDGQVKLIYFKPEITPPQCFEQVAVNLDTLIEQLEEQMREEL